MKKKRVPTYAIALASLALLLGQNAMAAGTYECQYLSSGKKDALQIPGKHRVAHVNDQLEAERQIFKRFLKRYPRSEFKNWNCTEIYP